MKTIRTEINRKKYILFRIMKEQDKRKDLSYKLDKELKLIKEIKELEKRRRNEKEICIKEVG
jgi:hypothetical protein